MKKITFLIAVLFTALSLAAVNTGNHAQAATTHAQVAIQNFAFSPASISVQKGSTVTWTNDDSTAHTVTGNTSGGPGSGHIQPGQSYSFTFNTVGTFPYHCSIHPEMTGKVMVTAVPVSQSMVTTPSSQSNSTGSMGSMPMNTRPASPESSEHQNPTTQLPDTGPGQIIRLFLLSTAAGTFIYYLIVHL